MRSSTPDAAAQAQSLAKFHGVMSNGQVNGVAGLQPHQTQTIAADWQKINGILQEYCRRLNEFQRQYWSGDKEWLTLAATLYTSLRVLQLTINNHELPWSERLDAVRQISAEFNLAIEKRVGHDLHKLQEHSVITRLLGKYKISIKTILADFIQRAAPELNLLLMRYQPDYIDCHLQQEMTIAKITLLLLCEKIPSTHTLANYPALAQEQPDLYAQLTAGYAGLPAARVFVLHAKHLFAEFSQHPQPLIGQWYPAAREMSALLDCVISLSNADAFQREQARQLAQKVQQLNWWQRLRLHTDAPSVTAEVNQDLAAPFINQPALSLPKYAKNYFFEIDQHILVMYQTVLALGNSVTMPAAVMQPLVARFRELYLSITTPEQGYVLPEDKACAENSALTLRRHFKQAKLIAIYEFCHLYEALPTAGERNFYDNLLRTLHDYTEVVLTLARKVDKQLSAYAIFLQNKHFARMDQAVTEQRKEIALFREQYWQGDYQWQKMAAELERLLKINHRIMVDRDKSLVCRLIAADEICSIFDSAIRARVQSDVRALTQHTVITHALQALRGGYYFNKISIKDILSRYRQHTSHTLTQSIAYLTATLTATEYKEFVYKVNFPHIYYQLSRYIELLHNFVMQKPRPIDQHLDIARKLLMAIDARAGKLTEIHNLHTDIQNCLAEIKEVSRDINQAIIAYRQHEIEDELAPWAAAAEAITDAEIKSVAKNMVAETSAALTYGKEKTELLAAVRQAVKNIAHPSHRATQFIDEVLKKFNRDPEFFAIHHLLPKSMLPLSPEQSSKLPVYEFCQAVLVIVDGLVLDDAGTYKENAVSLITSLIQEKLGATVAAPVRATMLKIILTEFDKIWQLFLLQSAVSKEVESLVVDFPLRLPKNKFLEHIFRVFIRHELDAKKLGETKAILADASTVFDLANHEELVIRKFMIERIKEGLDLTNLAGILVSFKRNDEGMLKGWCQEIEEEYKRSDECKKVYAEHRREHVPSNTTPPAGNGILALHYRIPSPLPRRPANGIHGQRNSFDVVSPDPRPLGEFTLNSPNHLQNGHMPSRVSLVPDEKNVVRETGGRGLLSNHSHNQQHEHDDETDDAGISLLRVAPLPVMNNPSATLFSPHAAHPAPVAELTDAELSRALSATMSTGAPAATADTGEFAAASFATVLPFLAGARARPLSPPGNVAALPAPPLGSAPPPTPTQRGVETTGAIDLRGQERNVAAPQSTAPLRVRANSPTPSGRVPRHFPPSPTLMSPAAHANPELPPEMKGSARQSPVNLQLPPTTFFYSPHARSQSFNSAVATNGRVERFADDRQPEFKITSPLRVAIPMELIIN